MFSALFDCNSPCHGTQPAAPHLCAARVARACSQCSKTRAGAECTRRFISCRKQAKKESIHQAAQHAVLGVVLLWLCGPRYAATAVACIMLP